MILVDLFDRVSIDVILNSFVCLIRFQIYTGSFVLYAKLITRFHGWSFLCRSPFFLAANSNYWSANKFFSGFYLKNVYTEVGQKKELAHHLDWVECAHSSIFVCVSTQFCVINEFTIFIWIAHRVRYIIHLLEFVMSFEWLCLSLNHFISDCERFIAFRFFVRIVVNEMPIFFVLNVCLLTETALFCRCVWKSRGAFFDWIIHVPV